jgi:hypothetical protein
MQRQTHAHSPTDAHELVRAHTHTHTHTVSRAGDDAKKSRVNSNLRARAKQHRTLLAAGARSLIHVPTRAEATSARGACAQARRPLPSRPGRHGSLGKPLAESSPAPHARHCSRMMPILQVLPLLAAGRPAGRPLRPAHRRSPARRFCCARTSHGVQNWHRSLCRDKKEGAADARRRGAAHQHTAQCATHVARGRLSPCCALALPSSLS